MLDPTWFLAQLPIPDPSSDPGRSLSPLEMGGIASIVVGGITALGTQMKPVIDGIFADRRHKREVEVVGLANDLNQANREIKLLKEENAHLKALVEFNQQRIDLIERNWKAEKPPVVEPSPEVVAAQSILPKLPVDVKEPPSGGAEPAPHDAIQ